MKREIVGSMSEWSGVLKDIFRQIGDGSLTMGHLQALLEHRNPFDSSLSKFPTWKTIKLGIHKTADEYRKAIKADGMKIGSWANDILGKPAFTVSSDEIEVELVRMTVAELGFKNGATRKDIYNKALELGLKLCPNEVGPALRLQYAGQPMNEWFLIAMEPIADSGGSLYVFGVGRSSDGSWLYGDHGHPDYFWNADDQWVFLSGK